MIHGNHDAILGELTRAVVERFAPERIVLFGSRARGDHRPHSDYDLMVVMDQLPQPWDVVTRTIQNMRRDVDVLVDTCEQFERRRTDIGTLEYIVDPEGQILYSRAALPEARQVREAPNGPPESLQEWIARSQSDFAMMELGLSGGWELTTPSFFMHIKAWRRCSRPSWSRIVSRRREHTSSRTC